MKDMGIVQGAEAQAHPLIIGVDTVYVHTNIEPLQIDIDGNPVGGLYQYQEIQYTKDEYLKLIAESSMGKNERTETNISRAMQQTAQNELLTLELRQQNKLLTDQLALSKTVQQEHTKTIKALGEIVVALELQLLAITKGEGVDNGVAQ